MEKNILLLLFGFVICVKSQDSNSVYLPEEIGSNVLNQTNAFLNTQLPIDVVKANTLLNARIQEIAKANALLNAQIQETAIKAGECRPAELDPEGHWGPVTGGFQLSIRCNTNVFVVSNTIPVTVILRNTTISTLSRLSMSGGGEACFTIEDGRGHIRQTVYTGSSGIGFVDLAGKHQIKHEFDLNKEFHLPAENYKVHVSQIVMFQSSDSKNIVTNVFSGILAIKVISP